MTSQTDHPPIRVGILGCARISNKIVGAICSPASTCTLTAAASRSTDKAKSMVESWYERHGDDCGDVAVMGGKNAYDEIIASDSVDALYVPLPTSLHREWVIKALSARKHVLVEKPIALHLTDYLAMLECAKRNNKYLQDGTMFVHNTRTNELLNCVSDEETFGTVNRINAEFTFMGNDEFFRNDIRTSKDGDPLGCVGDLSWYCIRMAICVFSAIGAGAVTSAQVVRFKKNEDGVPVEVTGLIAFDGDRVLSFHNSFLNPLRQKVEVCGSKRTAIIHDFVVPKRGTNCIMIQEQFLTEFDEYAVLDSDSIDCGSGPVQEVMMWRNFANCARGVDAAVAMAKSNGKSDIGWGDGPVSDEATERSSYTMENQMIVDALMESIEKGGEKIMLTKSDGVRN